MPGGWLRFGQDHASARALGAITLVDVAVTAGAPGRPRFALIADALVAAVAVSLPWSTSATSILIALWLIALIPIGPAAVWREIRTAAGGLPVLLWVLGALGMLWADASWS